MIKKHPRFATREYWMTEIDKREDALDRIRFMHSEDEVGYCTECYGTYWPCPTIKALEEK